MLAQIHLRDGSTDPLMADGVHHIHVRSDGTLVMRFADSKKTIDADDFVSFTVSGD